MIIPDDTPKTPIPDDRESPRPSPSQHTPLHNESPPAYYGSSSQATYIPEAYAQPSSVQEYPVFQYGESPARRFLRAFAVACLVWFLLTMFIRSSISLGSWDPEWDSDKRRWDYDIPSGLALSNCIQGSDWSSKLRSTDLGNANMSILKNQNSFPYTSQTSFSLPANSNDLFLLARGQLFTGTLNLITSPKQPRDTVTVRVRVHHNQESAPNLVKACKLAHNLGDEPSGLGLFTPRWRNGRSNPWKNEDVMLFETTVILHEVRNGEAPLFIRTLKADMPVTAYRFAHLGEKVLFDTVIVKGSSAPVQVKSLTMQNAIISTSNGVIRGTFNTTQSITLSTTNAEIDAHVGLEHSTEIKPSFTAVTTNGPIEVGLSLTATSTPSIPAYFVSATTSNSDLHAYFTSQPVGSQLELTTSTSNGPAEVGLHPAYEGRFELHSASAVVIKEGKNVRDPSGAGRERHVQYKALKVGGMQVVEGSVQWGEEEASRGKLRTGKLGGSVTVRNSNAPLTFEL